MAIGRSFEEALQKAMRMTDMAIEGFEPNKGFELVAAGLSDGFFGQYQGDFGPSGEIAGQLMITYEWSDWRNGNLWWIQSVYVPEKYRRQGVFSALYQHLESMAENDPGVAGIRLYVEKENTHAKKTYLSLGMSETNYDVMQTIRKPSAKNNA